MLQSICTPAPFVSSLIDYLETVPAKDLEIIAPLLCRYTARIATENEFYGTIRKKLPVESRNAVKLWRRWALSSYYWGDLWRALVGDTKSRKKIDPADIRYIMQNLTERDKERLQKKQGKIPTHRFSEETFKKLLKKITKQCEHLAWMKLRFISKYDQGVSQEDFVNELVEVGIKTLHRYEAEGNEQKALNYAIRSIKNSACNHITRFTTAKRARVINRHGEGGREYESLSISMEALSAAPPLEMISSSNDPLETIRYRLGPAYEHYALAVLGRWPEFDRWVEEWVGKNPYRLNSSTLGKLACQWTELPEEDVRQKLGGYLRESST
jgi:hypothetical protein